MAIKILIVDDSKSIRQQLRFALEKGSFEVVEAKDGVHGIEVLGDNPDVAMIISDVNMPNLNGLDMIEKIKADQKHADLPIVMLSTEGGPELIDKAKSLGAKGWLIKPFEPSVIVQAATKLTS